MTARSLTFAAALGLAAAPVLAQTQVYQPANTGQTVQPLIIQQTPGPANPDGENAAPPSDYRVNANRGFRESIVTEFPETVGTTTIADPSRTLTQGMVIEATFGGAISSELPGAVVGTIRRSVFSMDGTRVLIPRGSRLYGEYSADTVLAQTRLLIVWSRVITPDGISAQIGSTATDGIGRAGSTGYVDTHFTERFGSAALISILGIAPAAIVAGADGNAAQTEVVREVGSSLRDSTATVIEDYLSITPTIHIDQGQRVNAILQRDVVFDTL